MTDSRTSPAVEVKDPNLVVHSADLRRLFRSLGAEPQEIEDLVQQTFAQVLKKLRAGAVIDNTGGYCLKVGTNLYLSTWRRLDNSKIDFDSPLLEKLRAQPTEVWRNEPQDKVLASEEINMLIQEVSDALGEQVSAILQLAHGEGWSDEELARRFDLSEHSIRRHKTKINKWLKAKREGN